MPDRTREAHLHFFGVKRPGIALAGPTKKKTAWPATASQASKDCSPLKESLQRVHGPYFPPEPIPTLTEPLHHPISESEVKDVSDRAQSSNHRH